MKNFGSEIKLAITNFGLSLENMQQRHHDWNEESKALGLIEDSEKLRMLKRDLYCEARSNVIDTSKFQKLTDAIELFEELKQAEFERKQAEIKLQLSLPAQINMTLNSALMFILLIVSGSFLVAYKCGNYQSEFCSNARVIPTQVTRFYYNYFFK
jgi:hypothetical protein